MSHYFFRRGDILLHMGTSKFGSFVPEGMRPPGRKYKWPYTHVSWVVKDGEPAREPYAEIVEAANKVRRIALYPEHADDFVWCFRPMGIHPDVLELIAQDIEDRVGDPYGIFEIPAKWLDIKLFGGHIVTRWIPRVIWGANCDGLGAEVFEKYGHPIAGKPGWACTVNDIAEWMLARPSEYVVTWNGKVREYTGEVAC